jgi:Methylamine utilisation protein MauE
VSAALDPAVALALRAGFALLFATAVVHKLRAPREFRAAVVGFGILPARAVRPTTGALVLTEAAVVVLLVARPAAGGPAASAVLVAYAGAMTLALARGRAGIDCGCGGPGGGAPLQRGLVARNLLLAALALPLVARVGDRTLGWIDAVTVAGTLAAAMALFAAVSALLAAAPGIAALRRAGEGA